MKITKDNLDQVIGELKTQIEDQLNQGLEGVWENGNIVNHRIVYNQESGKPDRTYKAIYIEFPY